MIAEKLKKSILQAAIQGKLTQREPGDGTAAELLQQIAAEKAKLIKEGKIKKEKPLPEITENEKPFDLPEGWEWCKINEIAFVTKLAGFEYTKEISHNLSTNGIPLFKGKNIKDGILNLQFESYIPERVSDNLSRSQINKKCLLTPYVGSIGNMAIFDGSFKAHLGSNVGKIEFFKPFLGGISEEYALMFFKSDTGFIQLTKHKKATAQESISIEAIRDVIICIPPLAEQQRIVARVEELLAKVDSLSKDEKKLDALQSTMPERLKASLLQAAIQGKLTERLPGDGNAEDLLAEIAAEKQRLIKEKEIKKEKPLPEITEEEKPFDLPEGWAWCRLGEIVQVNPRNKNVGDDDIVSFMPMHMLEGGFLNEHTFEERKWGNVKNGFTHFCENDVVVAKITPCFENRKSAVMKNLINGYGAGTTELHVLRRYTDSVLSKYLLCFVKTPIFINGGIDTFTGTAGQQRVGKNYVQNILFPLPPLAEQQRIVQRLEELLQLCEGILQDKPLSVLKAKQKEKKNIDSVTVTSDNIKNISSLKKGENSLYKKFDKVKKSTYQVGLLDLVDEFASNPDFKKVFLSGLYVYVDRCLCINHPKYVQYNKQNQAVLTEYANKNKAECCLTFDVTMMMPKDGMTQQTVPITQTSLSSLSGANKEVQANASSLNGTGNEADETERIQRLLKNNFPESLKALMKYKGVTEESLAEALGVSSKTIQRLKKEPEVKRAAITAVCVVMNLNVVVYLDLLNVAGLHPTKSRQDNMIQLILGLRPNLTLAQFNDELENAGCAALNYGEK